MSECAGTALFLDEHSPKKSARDAREIKFLRFLVKEFWFFWIGARGFIETICRGEDENVRAGGNKPGLLTLTIKDKSALYLAYMPFVRNGGLFIPTNSNYRLGDEVFMLLNLMGEEEKLPVAGRVIWMTPKGAQGKRTAGIGVQFSDQDRGNTQKKIENYLAGALGGDKPTHTM